MEEKALALISWNKKEKRYELHIDGVFKGYSTRLEGDKDTQTTHKAGYDCLAEIAADHGYTVQKTKGEIN